MKLKVSGSINKTEYDAISNIFTKLSITAVFHIETCFIDMKGISAKSLDKVCASSY
jgi:hypothetical protein